MKKTASIIYRTAAGIFLSSILPLSSCLSDDDIPYPRIRANILEIEAVGQVKHALIDSISGQVTLFLNDSVDIQAVKLNKFVITRGATVNDSTVLEKPLNLADTLKLTLHIYQDWPWKISAEQEITRIFRVTGQIGQSEIDPGNHTVKAYVGKNQNLASITVEELKLGVSSATMVPDLNGKTVDFSQPQKIEVKEFGRSTIWTVTVETREQAVEIVSASAWSRVAWVTANVESGRNIAFEYKVNGTGNWNAVPQEWLHQESEGVFTARIIHLDPRTEYALRALSGDENTEEVIVRTGSILQVPNNTFTDWWQDGKVWCPWLEGETPFWGTGNKGAATLGESNTTPISDPASPSGYAGASLTTKFVGIGMLGKLAAGNLFAGSYVRTDGTNGVLSFGREFKERPTYLRATLEYNGTDISHTNSEFSSLKGQPDTCIVWVALTDASAPLEIRTKPSDRQLFDSSAPDVVAYGSYQFSGTMSEFETISIPLDYRSVTRVPNYILIVASASKYGDYFTGGAGSKLLIDKFELVYDYENDN